MIGGAMTLTDSKWHKLCRARARGFTLIETIASVVIMSVSVLGLVSVYTTVMAARNVPQPLEITKGTQFAQEGLERVIADRRSREQGKGFAGIVQGNYVTENLPGGYTRTTTVGAWPHDNDTNLYRQVTVQVAARGRVVGQGTSLVANY
jgi:prepilin-type N-terminal cleavage/methylation domain-containing protein